MLGYLGELKAAFDAPYNRGMNDEERLWDDDALEAEERARRRNQRITSLQRIPPRLLAAVIAAGMIGVITAVVWPNPIVVAAVTLAAAVGGAIYVNYALRRPTTVVIPAAITLYFLVFFALIPVGPLIGSNLSTVDLLGSLFVAATLALLPWILAGTLLWAAVVRAFEETLFSTEAREAARKGGRRDVQVAGASVIAAVVWVTAWLAAALAFAPAK